MLPLTFIETIFRVRVIQGVIYSDHNNHKPVITKPEWYISANDLMTHGCVIEQYISASIVPKMSRGSWSVYHLSYYWSISPPGFCPGSRILNIRLAPTQEIPIGSLNIVLTSWQVCYRRMCGSGTDRMTKNWFITKANCGWKLFVACFQNSIKYIGKISDKWTG